MLLPPYADKVNICNKIGVGLDEKKVDTVFVNNLMAVCTSASADTTPVNGKYLAFESI